MIKSQYVAYNNSNVTIYLCCDTHVYHVVTQSSMTHSNILIGRKSQRVKYWNYI